MHEPVLDLQKPVGDQVRQTTCYMCACRCGINVHLRDNKVRYIEGNPAHPVNRGVLCAKGSAGIMQHYSPARLDKPLLRVGERGIHGLGHADGLATVAAGIELHELLDADVRAEAANVLLVGSLDERGVAHAASLLRGAAVG